MTTARFQAEAYLATLTGTKMITAVTRYRVVDVLDGQVMVDRCGSLLQAQQIAQVCDQVGFKLRGEGLAVEIAEDDEQLSPTCSPAASNSTYEQPPEELTGAVPHTGPYPIEKNAELRSNSESHPEGSDNAHTG
ncbi:MAG: hypothetical protein DWQ07_15360 [Chloroflexi bacterium]|nr:MAG: hypothetical protein DWQ07_15360 [Chloroflexota bacterium]